MCGLQIDLLEEAIVTNVILLQTVLAEVRDVHSFNYAVFRSSFDIVFSSDGSLLPGYPCAYCR